MLADFGIAKLVGDAQRLTMPGLVIGTAAYMAPEQARGQPIDARTDLYSMGVVLYELLTGRVPFEADAPVALLGKHVYEPPPAPRALLPSLPAAAEAILLRALAKAAGARYQTAAEMAEACEQAAVAIDQTRTAPQTRSLPQTDEPAPRTGATTRLDDPAPSPRPATPASWVAVEGRLPVPTESRGRMPLIVAGALVLLALVAGALLLPSLLRSGSSAGVPTAAPAPTAAAAQATVPAASTAVPATAAPVEAAPTEAPPAPLGQVIFAEAFSEGAAKSGLVGRQQPPDTTLNVDQASGAYLMQLAQPNQTRAVLLPRFVVGDFTLEVDLSDASANTADGSAALGVVVRARDANQFYAVLIDPRGGRYAVRKQAGAQTTTDLLAWKESPLVRTGDATNQLRVDANGDTFTVYLNGARLDGFQDGEYRSGMVGTIAANEGAPVSTMRFDNLQVWSADPAEPAPDRPATLPGRNVSGDMVLVRGGEFVMGSNDDPANLPQVVDVPDFYIDRREVTNLAYLTCVDTFGCGLPGSLDSATRPGYHTAPDFNSYPVVNVTWQQAREFCERMDKRLPTEAEWEKAAGWNADSLTKSAWPWGNSFDPTRLNSIEANRGDTTRVGQFPAGPYGTVDMAGNAAEWTSSLDRPYPYDPTDGREDPEATGNRVVRGGSWAQPEETTTTYARLSAAPDTVANTIGFRCAADPE
jgi:formylglycine-generating enzyme required for sulfatase activity